MKILILADPRSPNFREFFSLSFFANKECLVISPYSHPSIPSVQLITPFSVTSSFAKSDLPSSRATHSSASSKSYLTTLYLNLPLVVRLAIYHVTFTLKCYLSLLIQYRQVRKLFLSFSPDLILAYRSQPEGYLASLFANRTPFLLFTQGSDFIFFTKFSIIGKLFTNFMLSRVSHLIADCNRDIFLAKRYGLSDSCTTSLMLGNGGIDFCSVNTCNYSIPLNIICPRIPAPYTGHHLLIEAFSLLLKSHGYMNPVLHLVSTNASRPYLQRLLTQFSVPPEACQVHIFLSKARLAQLFKTCALSVFPSVIDGLPVSYVESVCHGCVPVASDISSMTEFSQYVNPSYFYNRFSAVDLYRALLSFLSRPTSKTIPLFSPPYYLTRAYSNSLLNNLFS
ncbi:glycosyl transferases group 1 family protein [Synechococcus sp. WH 8103]|nr:glycosyl transferases group 1 family protein [Synechococcus sp. WH 8103]